MEKTIIDKLKEEHVLFLRDLDDLEQKLANETDIEACKGAVLAFIEDIGKHARVEETKVYPHFETQIKMGLFKSLAEVKQSFVEFERQDMQKVDQLVEIFLMVKSVEEAKRWFRELASHYRTHMEIEESVLFPMIEDMVEKSVLLKMAKDIALPRVDCNVG